mmetsp:Transcript_27318/g.69532  ORF Transcript_27318/g.69532 Transcript_27318/m.69532 type:complete len:289 (+) Transcript_27318:252-1118(+)
MPLRAHPWRQLHNQRSHRAHIPQVAHVCVHHHHQVGRPVLGVQQRAQVQVARVRQHRHGLGRARARLERYAGTPRVPRPVVKHALGAVQRVVLHQQRVRAPEVRRQPLNVTKHVRQLVLCIPANQRKHHLHVHARLCLLQLATTRSHQPHPHHHSKPGNIQRQPMPHFTDSSSRLLAPWQTPAGSSQQLESAAHHHTTHRTRDRLCSGHSKEGCRGGTTSLCAITHSDPGGGAATCRPRSSTGTGASMHSVPPEGPAFTGLGAAPADSSTHKLQRTKQDKGLSRQRST